MDNYNPRQPTWFRFKDSREIEKFVFISGEFTFISEVLEEASKNEPWSKIVNTIKNGSAYKPILIFDILDDTLYFGTKENDRLYLQSLYANQGYIIEIQYDITTDKLTITSTEESYLSDDNIKTLFGQDITGTGDINLYRHELIISTGRTSYDETEYKVYLTYYSSNNLVANTPEKLKTLTKANTTTILRGIVLEFANAGVVNATVSGKYSGVNYLGEQSGWALEKAIGGSDGTAITNVSDEVTPI